MDVDGLGFSLGGDPHKIHARIHAELSSDQILWLVKQSVLIDKTDLLKCAVIEWLTRHPLERVLTSNRIFERLPFRFLVGALWV